MIHVYTGNGKGKTTAAVGLAVRAAGAGKRVFFAQFVKGRATSELRLLRTLPNVTVAQFGLKSFIRAKPTSRDVTCARRGLAKVATLRKERQPYDLIVLDEIAVAIHLKLIDDCSVIELMGAFPPETEWVCTGRNACPSLCKAADLLSEIRERKHYFHRGVPARRGIEY